MISNAGPKRKRVAGSVAREKKYWSETAPTAPTVYHASVVIFLEFFAWGLLTTPTITVLNKTFPEHTFLCNGLIQGIKGILSFLSAPLIGALSDVLGRKPFLLITVTFTCAPIPFMKFSPWWYFALISMSGVFAVTFSIIFAYVADITPEEERSSAYGMVSATFAASLVTSPAIGAYLVQAYSENVAIALATAVAVLDIIFIASFMPESLPEKVRQASRPSSISWEKADPFGALRKIGQDRLILKLCIAVFFSYLPEAGQYSCFIVYLKLVVNFTESEVAMYIAMVGILSVIAQTVGLTYLMKTLGNKQSIMIGLTFQTVQLMWYGFTAEHWMIWIAGVVTAGCSISYPAISSFVSAHAEPDQQGVAQGIVTGIRGLCGGLGPAVFGFIFYLFHISLSESHDNGSKVMNSTEDEYSANQQKYMPGPPFVFGAVLVMLALLVAFALPDDHLGVTPARRPSAVHLDPKQRAAGKPEEAQSITSSCEDVT